MPRKLSASVMAHPSRERFFPYLREHLGKDTPFAIDTDGRGVWLNCRAAWLLHDPTAEYHVVIQDDALICKDFYSHAAVAIWHSKSLGGVPAINFYYGRRLNKISEGAEAVKRGYIFKSVPIWGVAICLPVPLIMPMLTLADRMKNRQDDHRIGRFLQANSIPIYFPMPSLVDHRTGLDSLVGDPGKKRRAYKFIDDVK